MRQLKKIFWISFLLLNSDKQSYSQTDFWAPVESARGYRIYSIFTKANGLILAGADSGIVFRSSNGGVSWNKTKIQQASTIIISFVGMKSGALFAGSTTSGIFRSTDDGGTWIMTSTLGVYHLAKDTSDSVLLGAPTGLYRSNDNRVSWIKLNESTHGFIGAIYSLVVNPKGYIFVEIPGQAVYRSIDFGSNWQHITNDIGSISWVNTLAVTPTNQIFAGVSNSAPCIDISCDPPNAGLFRTTTDGDSWSPLNWDPNLSPYSILMTPNVDIFVGTSAGVLRSTNSGSSWTATNSGISLKPLATILAMDSSGFLYVGTTEGLFRSNRLITSVEAIPTFEPIEFSLNQNYPNPFNPNTAIEFTVHRTVKVTLTILDALGRDIVEILNQELDEGRYRKIWDAKGFPSGTYFYRLITPEYQETKKMVLAK